VCVLVCLGVWVYVCVRECVFVCACMVHACVLGRGVRSCVHVHTITRAQARAHTHTATHTATHNATHNVTQNIHPQDRQKIEQNVREGYPPFAKLKSKNFQYAFKIRVRHVLSATFVINISIHCRKCEYKVGGPATLLGIALPSATLVINISINRAFIVVNVSIK
jgi:hypothetical protein